MRARLCAHRISQSGKGAAVLTAILPPAIVTRAGVGALLRQRRRTDLVQPSWSYRQSTITVQPGPIVRGGSLLKRRSTRGWVMLPVDLVGCQSSFEPLRQRRAPTPAGLRTARANLLDRDDLPRRADSVPFALVAPLADRAKEIDRKHFGRTIRRRSGKLATLFRDGRGGVHADSVTRAAGPIRSVTHLRSRPLHCADPHGPSVAQVSRKLRIWAAALLRLQARDRLRRRRSLSGRKTGR